MTKLLGRLVTIVDVIGLEAFVPEPPRGTGRPPEYRRALARGFVAKTGLGIPTTSALIERLAIDKSLRRILGWERCAQVPSEATFSRAFAEFAQGELPDKMHAALIERALAGASSARSRAMPPRSRRAKSRSRKAKTTRAALRRRRPPARRRPLSPSREGSADARARVRSGQKPKPPRLERQTTQSVPQMLADLSTACDVGAKKNSKGYKETWIGYKLHIDVASGQIPVACVLTSASVHDSQVAIPLMTMTSARVSYLYDLMDSAYDAAAIAAQSVALGHVPLIDRNFRAQHEAKTECAEEVARMKFIHLPDPDDVLYDFRTMVERINGRLKDEFGGRFVRVRGAVKVKCHLMFGILALTVDQIFRVGPFTPAPT